MVSRLEVAGRGGGRLKTWAFPPLAIVSAPCTGERSRAPEAGQKESEVGKVPLAVSNQVGVRMGRERYERTGLSPSSACLCAFFFGVPIWAHFVAPK